MKALILAAGFGRRLEPYTQTTPKPLFSISNRPLLDRVIRKLSSSGISSVMVNTHHLHRQIETYLAAQSYAIPVATRYEPEILGTGGAIKNLSDFWDDEPFMAINSDILFDTNLDNFCRYHRDEGSLASLMLCDNPACNQVWVEADNRIIAFGPENNTTFSARPPLTFTGIQIIHPAIMEFIPAGCFYSIIDAYKSAISIHKKIQAFIPEKITWTDIGSPERYRDAAIHSMALESFARVFHNHSGAFEITRLPGDGSDRSWYRLTSAKQSLIMVNHGIRTASGTQEVDAFIHIGRHLSACGVSVPEIYLSDSFSGLVFLQDLGDQHLQDVVHRHGLNTDCIPRLYRSLIDQLVHMGSIGIQGFDTHWTWQSAIYDQSLVMDMECRYFVEAFLNRYLDLNCRFADLENEFAFLSQRAATCAYIGFMHRDMQSRNIMVHQDQCHIIDFQGARIGPLGYDLASLLIDPYVALPAEMADSFFDYYLQQLSRFMKVEASVFRDDYERCRLTRNLQMLGAFGYLAGDKGKHQFETYIPAALQTLGQNLDSFHERSELTGLRRVVDQAENRLAVINRQP